MTYNYEIPEDAVIENPPGHTTHFEGVLNNCVACDGWRNQAIQVTSQANREITNAKRRIDEALKTAAETENGHRVEYLAKQLDEAKKALKAAEKRAAVAEAHRNALPVPTSIVINGIDVKEAIQIVFDSLAASMDAGSGFLDYREWLAIRQLGYALGVGDLDELTKPAGTYNHTTKEYDQPVWPDPKAPLTDVPAGHVDE